jgi:ribosomal protein RSM22 (predicted rRNA methylase)
MQLPRALRQAIEQELTHCEPGKLRAATARLTECYGQSGASASHAGGAAAALSNDEQRAAYLAVRVPATFAAAVAALSWTRESYSGELGTVLDLGSGPGTALWAALQVFPTLNSATAVERDAKLIEIARRLGVWAPDDAPHAALRNAAWLQRDLTASLPAAAATNAASTNDASTVDVTDNAFTNNAAWDLVVCSYALNELPQARRAEFLRHAWASTGKLLVIIEPGTKAGFANILAARTLLLAEGATLAAPCPNALACPMASGNDWCHFAARIERTAEHRRLKGASLGHEDEKFSYVAFSRGVSRSVSRNPAAPKSQEGEAHTPGARIVRHPKIFSGYTQLTLCREGEIAAATITRSKKDDWRRLKRLGWGDRW